MTFGGRLSSIRASMNGQHLAHVADDEPQPRMAIEDAREDHAQHVQPGLGVPAERGGAQEPGHRRGEARVVGVADGGHRLGRVQVERHAQAPRSARAARRTAGSSRKRPPVWPLTIAPLKPSSPTARSSSSAAAAGADVGSVAKPAKRSGCSATARASASLACARQRDRGVGIEVLDAGRGVADDLQVDAGLVHGGQAALAEVGEVGLQRRARGGVGVAQGADRPSRCPASRSGPRC